MSLKRDSNASTAPKTSQSHVSYSVSKKICLCSKMCMPPHTALRNRTEGNCPSPRKSTIPFSTPFKVPDDFIEIWNELKIWDRRNRA